MKYTSFMNLDNVHCWNNSLTIDQIFTSNFYPDTQTSLAQASIPERKMLSDNVFFDETKSVDKVNDIKLKLEQRVISKPDFNLLRMLITDLCNMSCKYCKVMNNINTVQKKPLVKEHIARILQYFFANSTESKEKIIHITGGEPTMFFETIKDIVETAKQFARPHENYWIVMGSNGVLIKDKEARYLAENNVKTIVSMDGPAIINDSLRVNHAGFGTWKYADKAIKLLKEYDAEVSISTVIGLHNIANIEHTIDWIISEYHPVGLGVNFMKPPTNTQLDFPFLIDEKSYATKIYDLHRKYRHDGIFFELVYRKLAPFVLQKFRYHDCGAANGSTLNINASGFVGPCKSFLVMNKLSLDKKGLDNYSNFVIKNWVARSPIFYEQCQNCPAMGVCGNGCAYEALSFTGNEMQIDTKACNYTKIFYELFLKDLYDQIPAHIKSKPQWIYKPTMADRLKLFDNVRAIPHTLSYSIGHHTL